MSLLQIILGVIFSLHFSFGLNFFNYGNEFEYLASELNETLGTFDSSPIQESWLEQPVNHFDSEDNRTWEMRFFERHDYWKDDKPIYLFLGGEGTAQPVFLKTGILYDLCRETNGAMFIAEHRYYGKSKPFENFTTDNLLYLSARQALADFAYLLENIKSMPKFKNSKVVVVGGSYSGNLAAWMKLLYPNLVDAAIASSAPVLAKVDFFEYLETVSDNFEQYGSSGCWDRINEKFDRYDTLFKSNKGIEILKKEENICGDCNMEVDDNKELFFLGKTSEFMSRSQYGNPDAIKEYCDSNFTRSSRRFSKHDLLYDTDSDCYTYDFEEMVSRIKYVDWYTSWLYQTCTEFGYYQTGSSLNQPFTRNVRVDFYYKMCTGVFGASFDADRVERGVQESNKIYGGLNPNVTKVVFVNGDMDPWSKLGILEDLSYDAPAKVISQASHCRDLFSDTKRDPEELKEARRYIRYLIRSWIGEGEYRYP